LAGSSSNYKGGKKGPGNTMYSKSFKKANGGYGDRKLGDGHGRQNPYKQQSGQSLTKAPAQVKKRARR